MKIILVNYRYFVSGGPERYMFNVTDVLNKKGHEVIPFSIKSAHNKPTEYEKYFINPVGKPDAVYFGDQEKSSLKTIVTSFGRMYYSFEAKIKLEQLIRDVKPDLIYVLHYQNKISASIFDAAGKYKIPVVHRISDFGQICANHHFFRPQQKDICERCLHGSKWHAVANKCVHDSYIYSAIKAGSLVAQKMFHVESKIKAFVLPSGFTLSKLVEYGFPKDKLFHIPTFFNTTQNLHLHEASYKPYALYIGRIEEEKGLHTMVKAFAATGHSLKIIGFSNTGYENVLLEYLKGKEHNIEFVGRKNFEEIIPYLQSCAFTIVPSEWYDNFPNTVLESYAFKKCVVATRVGSLIEMVVDNETGLLFNLKDGTDLAAKINILFSNLDLCRRLGEKGYEKIENDYGVDVHYSKLMNVFDYALKQAAP